MSDRPRPFASRSPGRVLGRALLLLCPRCGRGRLYAGWFTMRDGCGACGLAYEREQGYFVGAIYVNYAVTAGVAVTTVLLLDWLVGLTLAQQLAIGIALSVLVPLVFFRYARSLWLSLEYLLTAADERRERARRPRR